MECDWLSWEAASAYATDNAAMRSSDFILKIAKVCPWSRTGCVRTFKIIHRNRK
jgi:hypothetical protein